MLAQRPLIDPEAKNMWRIAGSTGAVGIEIAVAIAIGYLGGGWLDRKFGTTPWLTYIGFLSGVGAAVKAIVRVTRQYKRGLDEDETKTALNPTTLSAKAKTEATSWAKIEGTSEGTSEATSETTKANGSRKPLDPKHHPEDSE